MPLISSCHVEFRGSAHGDILHVGLRRQSRLAFTFPRISDSELCRQSRLRCRQNKRLWQRGCPSVTLFCMMSEYVGPWAFSKAFLAILISSLSSKMCCLRSSTSAPNLSE